MRSRLVAAIILAAAVLPGAGVPARAAADAGQVVGMAGQCFDNVGGQRTALKLGDAVHVGDAVEVPAGAKLKLRMADGSVISVASGSRLTIQAYSVDGAGHRTADLALSSGLLRAVVSVVSPPSTFEVATATGVAAVRSTDWFIRTDQGSTQVGVLAGDVTLTSQATKRTVSIPARWGARVEAGRDPVPARVWTAQEFDDVISRTNLN